MVPTIGNAWKSLNRTAAFTILTSVVLRLFHRSTDGHLHSDHRQTGRQLNFLLGSAVLHSQQVLLSRRFDARRRVSCSTHSGCASEVQLFALLAHATSWFLPTCTTEAFWTLAVVLRQAANVTSPEQLVYIACSSSELWIFPLRGS